MTTDPRLIAAAPAMLKALQRLTHPMADDEDLRDALAVIARATGQPIPDDTGDDEGPEDAARLIAAAPALLTALAELVGALEADAMDDKSNVYRSMMLSANHAIARATRKA